MRWSKMTETTTDAFLSGRLQVTQPRGGYRFSIDAVLLAHHVKPAARQKVVDLGSGVGIIPLLLAYRHPRIQVCGIEIQAELSELAVRNAVLNQMADRIAQRCGDMRSVGVKWIGGSADWVICNPPFRRCMSGRLNPKRQKAIARHEIKVNLSEIVDTARRMLRLGGRFSTIYPVERLTDVLVAMRSAGIEPKILRLVQSRQSREAKLFLVEGKKGGRSGVCIRPPLIVYQSEGVYSREVAKMFEP